MSYNIETTKVDARLLNQGFLNKVERGMEKEASDAVSFFVRDKLRELGFARKIFQPELISSTELDRQIDTDEPVVFVEKELDSEAASMSFRGTADIRYYTGKRFPVIFSSIKTAEFKKSKFELMTNKVDITTILQENSVKDLQKQEDVALYNNMVAIATAQSSIATTGVTLTIPHLLSQCKVITGRQLPLGKILMTQSTYLSLLAEPATQIGSPLASALVTGQEHLEQVYGWQVVTTIKNDIVPDNRVMFFADTDYLGKMYLLQDATAFVKTEADILTFNMYEAVGMGFGNVKGIHIADFVAS